MVVVVVAGEAAADMEVDISLKTTTGSKTTPNTDTTRQPINQTPRRTNSSS
jgi:hypothetical protein